ncbi:hypothetical protein SALBM135S_02396 [Streptomyces alboniger]
MAPVTHEGELLLMYASTLPSAEAAPRIAAETSAAQTGKSTSQSSSTTAARDRKYSYTEDRASPVRSARAEAQRFRTALGQQGPRGVQQGPALHRPVLGH